MMGGIEWGHVIPICVGSYLFVWGQGGGGDLKWFVKNVVIVLQNIQQPVCRTKISQLSQRCQASDLCTADGDR